MEWKILHLSIIAGAAVFILATGGGYVDGALARDAESSFITTVGIWFALSMGLGRMCLVDAAKSAWKIVFQGKERRTGSSTF